MKAITKLILKIFLFPGTLFGLFMIAEDLFNGQGFHLIKFLSAFLFFGTAMTLLFVPYHIYKLKKNGVTSFTDESLSVRQSKLFKSSFNLQELTTQLKLDKRFSKMKILVSNNGLSFSSGLSWKSFGEEIKIYQKSCEDSQYVYQVSSESVLKTTMIDYGRNLENVNQIGQIIKTLPNTK